MTGRKTSGGEEALRKYGRIRLAIDENRLEGDSLVQAENELRSIEWRLGIPKWNT